MKKIMLILVFVFAGVGAESSYSTNDERYWLEFTRNYDFAKKYLKVGDGVECLNNESESLCWYEFIAPLKLKGKITFRRDYQASACERLEINYFESNQFPFEVVIVNIPEVKLPQWFRDGLSGEVSYEAQISIKPNDILSLDYSACGDYNKLNASQVKITKKINEKIYGREKYMDIVEYTYRELQLNTNDSYVNLRKSPNGEILTQIKMKDKDKIVLFDIGSDDKSKWIKVIYFPPNVENAKDAIIGYIHESQVKRQ